MSNPKKKPSKGKKRKITIKSGAKLQKKGTKQKKDSLQTIEGRPPASVAPVFRVKIKKK